MVEFNKGNIKGINLEPDVVGVVVSVMKEKTKKVISLKELDQL
jgi:hypothetical protein